MNANATTHRTGRILAALAGTAVVAAGGIAIWQTSTTGPAHTVAVSDEMVAHRKLLDQLNRGKRLAAEGEFEAALDLFEQLVAADADPAITAEADLSAARMLSVLERFDEAQARFSRIIEAGTENEPDARAHFGLAEAYSHAGDDARAAVALAELVDRFKDIRADHCADGLFTLTQVYRRLGDEAMARGTLARIVHEFPGAEGATAVMAQRQIGRLRGELAAAQEPAIEALVNDGQALRVDVLEGEQTRWDHRAGPYVIATAVTVPAGALLAIAPGVTVRFSAEGRLVVKGRLEAVGTAEQPIVFGPIGEDPKSGWWSGIDITPASAGETSRIEHARIHSAEVGILCEGGAVTVRHVTVGAAADAGLYVTGEATATVADAAFLNGAHHGVRCDRGASLKAERMTVRDNGGSGVTVAVTRKPVEIVEAVASGNRGGGIVFRDAATGTLQKADVHHNRVAGVLCRSESAPTLADNRIHDNEGEGIRCLDRCSATIERNEITANRADGISFDQRSIGAIRGNTITGNGGAGIRCRLGSDPEIADNRIADNRQGGIWLLEGAAPMIRGNTFANNTAAALRNHSPGVVDAAGNDWGTTDPAKIAEAIEDQADNQEWGQVNWQPQ